ncbi:MAG TPA: cupin domain-containing protein [Longimicrobiales bacterium]|nr:cupin domain-containing protein [Longimicrobiales bacterium]
MAGKLLSHVVTGCVAAALGSAATWAAQARPAAARQDGAVTIAEAQSVAPTQALQTLLFETALADLPGRVGSVRAFERAPGTGGTPHRHPGSHIFGYVLEGVYEVQVDDGPLRRLGPGEVFYEPPGALHAVSRNGSATEPVRYLVFTVADPSLPATVPE